MTHLKRHGHAASTTSGGPCARVINRFSSSTVEGVKQRSKLNHLALCFDLLGALPVNIEEHHSQTTIIFVLAPKVFHSNDQIRGHIPETGLYLCPF